MRRTKRHVRKEGHSSIDGSTRVGTEGEKGKTSPSAFTEKGGVPKAMAVCEPW